MTTEAVSNNASAFDLGTKQAKPFPFEGNSSPSDGKSPKIRQEAGKNTHSDGKSPKIRQEAVAPTGGLPWGAQNRIFITMMRAMQRTRRTPDMPQTPRVSSRVVKTTSWLASIQMQKMVKRMTLIT